MNDILIKNIGVLATPQGTGAVSGDSQGDVRFITNASIAAKDGKITFVGNLKKPPEAKQVIDAGGRLVTPGLVDSHTHLVFGGYRQHELSLKLQGASYLEILLAGGGILSTVETTRKLPQKNLYTKSLDFLKQMLAHGTTTVEAKSGYGLDLVTELKQLQVIHDLSADFNIVSTFMGAHAIPNEYKANHEAYVDFVIEDVLPVVAARRLATFCDVFCEKSVFGITDSRRILSEARKLGFRTKIHADEIESMGGAGLAAELGCISAEHLLESKDSDLDLMAKAGVIAVLLPATSFYLNKAYARARDMINKGIPVAIATDFNPGSSPNFNMQLVLNLACLKLKLSPTEALTAATLNGAAAIGMAKTKGSIEEGKDADIIIWNAPDLDFLFYRYGNNQVFEVIRKGWQP